MMEKSCKNCRKNRCDAVTFTLCMDPEPYKDWQPDYQTLESQLSETQSKLDKANELVKEYIEEICGLREAIEKVKSMSIQSKLDEYLPDDDKIECYEMGYKDALTDMRQVLSINDINKASSDHYVETLALIIEQIEQIAKEREYSQKLQAQILNRYNELFKNYTFTDCETAIDLMAGEIQVLRAELEQYKEALLKPMVEVMWVARDKDGLLALFADKPYRSSKRWLVIESMNYIELSNGLFPDLKWEDEPLEVELVGIKRGE